MSTSRLVGSSAQGTTMHRRQLLTGLGIVAILVLLAVPVLAGGEGKQNAPGQLKEKVEKLPITITGTVEVVADENGDSIFTLRDGGTTYTLDAGPPWFFGNDHPLQPYVGQSVTVDGEVADGSTEVDVLAVDGTALREPGKPPWAGGWKVVGERHPGWSQEKADRFEAKFGDCFPPGQCKDKPAGADEGEPRE
jgi:hypothetical protein